MTDHSHPTEDVMPEGQCPGCDNYWLSLAGGTTIKARVTGNMSKAIKAKSRLDNLSEGQLIRHAIRLYLTGESQ